MTKQQTLIAAVLAATALGAALGSRDVPTADAKIGTPVTAPASARWEYLVVQGGTTNLAPSENSSLRKEPDAGFGREAFPLEGNLDKLGAKGWELVDVGPGPTYYFKRAK